MVPVASQRCRINQIQMRCWASGDVRESPVFVKTLSCPAGYGQSHQLGLKFKHFSVTISVLMFNIWFTMKVEVTVM